MNQLLFAAALMFQGQPLTQKGPDWWCRATSDKAYLAFGVTQEEACSEALKKCRESSPECIVTEYGEW